MQDEDLVRLAFAETEVDANYLKDALAEHDIKVLMMGNEASAFGMSLDGEDSVELFVHRDDYEKAKPLVEELMSDEGEPIPAWICKCGEEVDEGFGVCWSCGAAFEPDESND